MDEGEANMLTINKFFHVVLIFAALMLVPPEVKAEKRIGFLLFSEETRYYDAKKGLLDQLSKAGFKEPVIKITAENAHGNKVKASEIVRKFAEEKFNLIIPLGTSATIAVTREITEIPVVFSMVWDPVEVGVAKGWKSSGNNTTGTSPKVPMTDLMRSLKELAPVKRLAVLYTPGEKNSEAIIKELREVVADFGITLVPVILTKQEEIPEVLSGVVPTVDAVYLTGSSVVGLSVPLIVDIATKAKVATITHNEEFIDKGVLMGVCANPYKLGRMAGEKAVKILRGAKPSAIPIEADKKFDLILNSKTAKAGTFMIPPSFMKKVNRKIE